MLRNGKLDLPCTHIYVHHERLIDFKYIFLKSIGHNKSKAITQSVQYCWCHLMRNLTQDLTMMTMTYFIKYTHVKYFTY